MNTNRSIPRSGALSRFITRVAAPLLIGRAGLCQES
jgi:hypothetical protein